jgi:hypothetical protein
LSPLLHSPSLHPSSSSSSSLPHPHPFLTPSCIFLPSFA